MTDQNDKIVAAASNPLIPHLYVNGFNSGCGAVDLTVTLDCNDKIVATLNMSYACAKSMRDMLAIMVDSYEKIAGVSVMTHSDFHNRAMQHQKQPN
jgi:hypothetical protein